jgi:hypothetical protein
MNEHMMDKKKQYDEVKKFTLDLLFRYVPEIENLDDEKLKAEFEWQKTDPLLPYIVYEDVLCPYYMLLLKRNDKKSKEIAKRIKELIELLANHHEFEVRCLAKVGFLEKLVHDIKPRKLLDKVLLPKSLEMAKSIAKNAYDLDPYTWEPIKKSVEDY